MDTSYSILKDSFEVATAEIGAVKFDRFNETHRTLMSLYATIYEQVEAGIVLYEAKRYNGAILMLRPILEANVDFLNLLNHPSYIGFMEWKHLDELKKLLAHGMTGKNPFLAGYANNADANRRHKELEKELRELKKKGFGKLSIFDKFKKADMEEEYQSVYNMLCSESHNNIRSLNDRHIELVGENDFHVVINAVIPENRVETLLHGLLGSLLSTSIAVHAHFKSPSLDKFEPLHERWAKLFKPETESADGQAEAKAVPVAAG